MKIWTGIIMEYMVVPVFLLYRKSYTVKAKQACQDAQLAEKEVYFIYDNVVITS